jgi:hypothetical protein
LRKSSAEREADEIIVGRAETELVKLYDKAKNDEALRRSLLATREHREPVEDFCRIAAQSGCEISPGELMAMGQEYSDNQCKSTNGGNPSPYEWLGDEYEIFLDSIS